MEIYYWKVNPSNFGDELNPWLWKKILPEIFSSSEVGDNSGKLFVGIGTLINHKLPKERDKIIFGAGVGYGDLPTIDDSYSIYFVRGPLSADALKLSKDKFITDPAILINSCLEDTKKKIVNKHKISFSPHYSSYKWGDWDEVCRKVGIKCISPFQKVDKVILDICSSELVITDSMHGAIFADSLRIPWIPIHPNYGHILDFKWRDWSQSMCLEYAPHYVDPVWRGGCHKPFKQQIKNLIKRGLHSSGVWREGWEPPEMPRSKPGVVEKAGAQLLRLANNEQRFLSRDNIFEDKLNMCLEKVEQFRREFAPR
ncbi:succinoglycan biosynthesis protein ExoV [Geoalkalibacter ferrihydriticus]|uniref:Succinoglycan biosynthesis protein ExoV n=1 Tax=Geoalkalibacter ferrihydriticus TaxID=392333 RepID=A0A1G9WI50_9BACT|nr:polysaccharide pyruvyl transferase family protein [Geoalkalibacter ferrihydriticus]SDM84027.1 succinoglycan biosynthesis protein ExoV [Geoalkalibacter ferrihydriticus]